MGLRTGSKYFRVAAPACRCYEAGMLHVKGYNNGFGLDYANSLGNSLE